MEEEAEAGTSTTWDAERAAFLKRFPSPWRRVERLLLRQGVGQPAAAYVQETRRVVEVSQLEGGEAGVLAMAKARFVEGLLPECCNPAMEMAGVDLEQCFVLAERAELVNLRRAREGAAGVTLAGAGACGGPGVVRQPETTLALALQSTLDERGVWDQVAEMVAKECRQELAQVKEAMAKKCRGRCRRSNSRCTRSRWLRSRR